jgi:hypothetical protein
MQQGARQNHSAGWCALLDDDPSPAQAGVTLLHRRYGCEKGGLRLMLRRQPRLNCVNI